MRKLIPIILALVGTGAGIGAGLFLAPPAQEAQETVADCAPPETIEAEIPNTESGIPPEGREYVKLNNQFVVPVMGPERVQSLVVASFSIEVGTGDSQMVYAREPKLRDVFLQVLFDHANIGGFEGAFTDGERMQSLRRSLLQAARGALGPTVTDVLITEIARQDS